MRAASDGWAKLLNVDNEDNEASYPSDDISVAIACAYVTVCVTTRVRGRIALWYVVHSGRCSFGGPVAVLHQFFMKSITVSTDQFDSRAAVESETIRPSRMARANSGINGDSTHGVQTATASLV
jgi:hypothetical protein